MAIFSEANAVRQAFSQIGEEVIRATRVTLPDEPARNKFCISIERNLRPNVARAFRFHWRRGENFHRPEPRLVPAVARRV